MRKAVFTVLLAVFAFTSMALAVPLQEVDPGKYEFVSREDLDYYIKMEQRIYQTGSKEEGQLIKQFIGKQVNFCDELSVFWDELEDSGTVADKRAMEEKGYIDDYDNQEFLKHARFRERYYKFETYNFRCLVPRDLIDSVAYVRYANRVKNERRLLMIWGKVARLPVYLPIDNTYGARDYGVEPEDIFIVVHQVKRPRPRFFEEWRKEGK